jgi:hypothetical protein
MKPIKSSATKRKEDNTMPTDPEAIREVVSEDLVELVDLEVLEAVKDLTELILILATCSADSLDEDLVVGADREKTPPEKTSRSDLLSRSKNHFLARLRNSRMKDYKK